MNVFHVVLAFLGGAIFGAIVGAFFAWNNPKQSVIDKAIEKLNSKPKA